MVLQHLGRIKEGKIIEASNLGIIDFDIVDILKKKLNFDKIYLRNDGKCAALCEKTYGSLKNYEDAIFLCLGTGIGGAVFKEGKLLSAKKKTGFEFRTCCNKKGRREMYLWE